MRLTLAVALAALAVGAVQAEETCGTGTSTAIELLSWSAQVGPGSFAPTVVDLELKNNLPKGIRMLDASIFYVDVLGRDVGRYGLDPDTKAAASSDFSQQGVYFSDTRLIEANPSDIVVTICTRQVVYDDGTVEKFD